MSEKVSLTISYKELVDIKRSIYGNALKNIFTSKMIRDGHFSGFEYLRNTSDRGTASFMVKLLFASEEDKTIFMMKYL